MNQGLVLCFLRKTGTAQRANFMKMIPFLRFRGGVNMFAYFAHVTCHCDVDSLVNIIIFKYYLVVHIKHLSKRNTDTKKRVDRMFGCVSKDKQKHTTNCNPHTNTPTTHTRAYKNAHANTHPDTHTNTHTHTNSLGVFEISSLK